MPFKSLSLQCSEQKVRQNLFGLVAAGPEAEMATGIFGLGVPTISDEHGLQPTAGRLSISNSILTREIKTAIRILH